MSRSYKKTPVSKDGGCKKWVKRQAAKAVRRYDGKIAKGGSYKKLFEQWNICDYWSYEEWNVHTKRSYEMYGWNKSHWLKWYYRK